MKMGRVTDSSWVPCSALLIDQDRPQPHFPHRHGPESRGPVLFTIFVNAELKSVIRQHKLGVAGWVRGFIPSEIGTALIEQVDPGTGHIHTGAPGVDFDQTLVDGHR